MSIYDGMTTDQVREYNKIYNESLDRAREKQAEFARQQPDTGRTHLVIVPDYVFCKLVEFDSLSSLEKVVAYPSAEVRKQISCLTCKAVHVWMGKHWGQPMPDSILKRLQRLGVGEEVNLEEIRYPEDH